MERLPSDILYTLNQSSGRFLFTFPFLRETVKAPSCSQFQRDALFWFWLVLIECLIADSMTSELLLVSSPASWHPCLIQTFQVLECLEIFWGLPWAWLSGPCPHPQGYVMSSLQSSLWLSDLQECGSPEVYSLPFPCLFPGPPTPPHLPHTLPPHPASGQTLTCLTSASSHLSLPKHQQSPTAMTQNSTS